MPYPMPMTEVIPEKAIIRSALQEHFLLSIDFLALTSGGNEDPNCVLKTIQQHMLFFALTYACGATRFCSYS